MNFQKALRPIILTQLLLPLALLVFGIYHGLMQVLYRSGLLKASSFMGIEYYQGLTAHGVINAILLTSFFAVAFGNAISSQFLGQRVSVKGAYAALILMIIGTLSAAAAIFLGQANVLYTFYPPLKAHPAFYLGLALFIVGTWIAFYSWIPGYLKWRRENPNKKTPIAVVGIFSTFIVWQIATLPVAFEVLVLLLPWSLGLTSGVNVTLARTLFWFFGHPLVYFWLLPTYTLYYAVLPKMAGGKLFSDFGARFAFLMFCVFSSPLGLHHQFADPGISSNYKAFHAVLTSIVSIPSLITAFTLAASLEYAAKRNGGTGWISWWSRLPFFDSERWLFPYLFCGLIIFVFGGLTGVVNASYNVNLVVHNTAWVPAHFHLTVAGPVFLGILGMSLYLILGLTGKPLRHPKLAMLVPYLWTLGVLTFSSGLFWGGLHGEPRRTNMGLTYLNPGSPSFRPDWVTSSHFGVLGGIVMTIAVLVYFYSLIESLSGASSAILKENFKIPESEALHDEDIGAVKNFTPWIIAGVVAVIIAYTPVIQQIMSANYQNAPGFRPDSPIMVEK
ncbi:MAG: cbb3-type cytochrome c oxidase subunit I [Oligoflexia bacterium]|nr:cbb3-type cytochrome c oxidase subunit I [Oligoflexia bacterium]